MNFINDERIKNKLNELYLDSKNNDPIHRQELKALNQEFSSESDRYRAMNKLYMAVNVEFGNLLYMLVRNSNVKNIVEYGTSFGVSTIYLAAALRDNGGGKIISTELDESKVLKAMQNLRDVELDQFVEIRVGDAVTSLQHNLPESIDMLFLDGAKSLYLNVLKTVESKLRPGAILVADNTDHDGLENYLEYVRDTKNGYLTAAISTSKVHEISIKG